MYYTRNNNQKYGGGYHNYNLPTGMGISPVKTVSKISNDLDESYSLAMCYVPWQTFRELYDSSEALCHGTIFKELDLKFCG